MSSPDLSFVIIEYHSLEDVSICAAAIQKAVKGLSYDIIVSSNSVYPLEEQERIRKNSSDLVWVFNKSNGGFASGMNAGLAQAKSPVVVTLNPDVQIHGDNVKSAYDYLMANPQVGLLGPRILDSHGNQQDTCRKFMTLADLVQRMRRRFFEKRDVLLDPKRNYNEIQTVDWVIGAFMMARTEALRTVGYLDPGYFLYVEDMDWCKRFWDAGYQVVYYPKLVVEYKGDRKSLQGLKTGKWLNRYAFLHLKSYLRFLKKHGLNASAKKSKEGVSK